MVRITRETSDSQPFDTSTETLVELLAGMVAENPGLVQQLLESYGMEFPHPPDAEELTFSLADALDQDNSGFNRELAALILYTVQGDNYSGPEESAYVEAIAGAVGGVSNAIAAGSARKQARDQATTNSLQSVMSYRAQLASNAHARQQMKTAVAITLVVVLGIGLSVAGYYLLKSQPAEQVPTA